MNPEQNQQKIISTRISYASSNVMKYVNLLSYLEYDITNCLSVDVQVCITELLVSNSISPISQT